MPFSLIFAEALSDGEKDRKKVTVLSSSDLLLLLVVLSRLEITRCLSSTSNVFLYRFMRWRERVSGVEWPFPRMNQLSILFLCFVLCQRRLAESTHSKCPKFIDLQKSEKQNEPKINGKM